MTNTAAPDTAAPGTAEPGTAAPDRARIVTLDAVRGFAVMGILLLNIVGLGMPTYAYGDPYYYGGATGANWAAWAINFILADGKMRGLFTMMFGASILLICERAVASGQSAARVHYSRMLVLFLIGMVHAYLIWSGDILVLYSACGAIAFFAWRWRRQTLLAVAGVLLAWTLLAGLAQFYSAKVFETRAAAANASPALRAQWRSFAGQSTDSAGTIQAELTAHRGSYAVTLDQRVQASILLQTRVLPRYLLDTIALMLMGMALFRSGFFSGEWSRRSYRGIAVASFSICVPLYLPLVWWLDAARMSPVAQTTVEAIHLTLLQPWLSLGWASLVILFVKSGALTGLRDRLSAVGRAALSNYLGTSIVCTLIFDGYGLGWFGQLERWQLYPIVLGVWVLMLIWSKPFLERFAYGPAEWLWRSLARFQRQDMRRTPIANHPQF